MLISLANVLEAISVIHNKKPDVVFLDIQMPRIAGLEMVQMLDPQHRPYIILLPLLTNTPFRLLRNTLLTIY